MSFAVSTSSSTFLVESAALNKINFNYNIEGGLYSEVGTSPYKGKIIGKLLDNNNWQVDIDVWVKMTDMHNKEVDRQLAITETFSPN